MRHQPYCTFSRRSGRYPYEEQWQRKALSLAGSYINPALEAWYGCWESHTCPPVPISRIEYPGHREPRKNEGGSMVVVTFKEGVDLFEMLAVAHGMFSFVRAGEDGQPITTAINIGGVPRDEQFFRDEFWRRNGPRWGQNIGCWESDSCPVPVPVSLQATLPPGETLSSPLIAEVRVVGTVGESDFSYSPLWWLTSLRATVTGSIN